MMSSKEQKWHLKAIEDKYLQFFFEFQESQF